MVGSFLGAGAGSLFGPSDTVHDETVGGLIRAGGDAYGGNEGEFATSAFSTLGGNRFTEGAVGIADNTAKKLNILLATIDGKLFPVADEGAGEDYKDGGFTPPHWNPGATEISVKQGKRVNLYGSTSVVHETGGVYQPSWNLPEQAMDQIGVHTLKQAAFHGFLDAPQQYIDVINNYSEETSGEPETLSNLYRTLLSASDADTLPGAIARSSTRLLEYSYADYKTNTPKEFLTQSVNTGRYGVFENGVNLTRMSYRDYLAAKKYDPNAPYEWKPIYEDKQVRNPDYVAEGKDFKDFASTMIKNPLQNQLEYEEYINQPEAELLNITNRFTGYTDPKGVYQPDVTEAEYLTNLNWGDERGNWGPATTVTQIANPTYIEPGLSREEFNAMRNTQRNVNPQHIATIDNYVDQLLTTGTVV